MAFTPGPGGGGGSIAGSSDVSLDSVQDNQVLTYESSSSKWTNRAGGTQSESEYGPHYMVWNGTDWDYSGEAVSTRPSVPAWPDAWVVWITVTDSTYNTPPPLMSVYDKWEYNKDVTPTGRI